MSTSLQKHKVENMGESDAHMVMAWLTDAIDSLESPDMDTIAKQDAPLSHTEDAVYPQKPDENLVTDANRGLELADTDKSKTNLPPEFGQRKKGSTAAMPFLRRKEQRSKEETESLEKSVDGLRAWAAIEKAAFSLDMVEDQCDNSLILKTFSVDEESFDLSQVLKGTYLDKVLTSPNRPSVEWWDACSGLAKSLEGLEESGSFAVGLYYYSDSFDPDDFISKTGTDGIATGGKNIKVLDYDTKNFDICPGSVAAFENILEYGRNAPTETQALIKKAAKETDRFLGMEKKFLDKGKLDTNELEEMVRSIANSHYMAGQLAEQLDKDLTSDFAFTAAHITNVSSLLEREMELQKADQIQQELGDPFSAATALPGTTLGEATVGVVGNKLGEMGQKIVESSKGLNKEVDDLIYTEDEGGEIELCQKCASDIEKCGHKRKDLEAPSETGPMDRGEQRPNVIMRSNDTDITSSSTTTTGTTSTGTTTNGTTTRVYLDVGGTEGVT